MDGAKPKSHAVGEALNRASASRTEGLCMNLDLHPWNNLIWNYFRTSQHSFCPYWPRKQLQKQKPPKKAKSFDMSFTFFFFSNSTCKSSLCCPPPSPSEIPSRQQLAGLWSREETSPFVSEHLPGQILFCCLCLKIFTPSLIFCI